ncbi:MAG TPA: flagellar biosynthetic protein FliP [Tenacibaculum sp.]|nr:flagellar biosynthetic protein FliP [Tenacibaculum sp.]
MTVSKLLLPLGALLLSIYSSTSFGLSIESAGVNINIDDENTADMSAALKLFITFTILSLAPSILIVMTSFTRIIVVLAMLRQAFGMPATPPNTVLISLAIFLTFFTMTTTLQAINEDAFKPLQNETVTFDEALEIAVNHLKIFMVKHTHKEDFELMVNISKTQPPGTISEVSLINIIPAFMLSELKTAFQIGFIIFLPFLLIDIVIASILMSMGMLMVPPLMISLPIKVLMFVLIDGWNLVVTALVGSFH